MKRRFLFLAITMAAMMAASVGLTSCNKDDGGTDEVQPEGLRGTWVCTNEEAKEVVMAMTFYKGNTATVNLEGLWLECNVERTATSMKLKGTKITMVNFKDFGNFTAKTVPFSVTVTFNYQQNGNTLVISNINATPALTIQFRQSYELKYDKVYEGEIFIF